MPLYSPHSSYRLVLSEDPFGSAQTIEFDAPSAEAALHRLRQQYSGREAELFEDGRSLGRVKCVADGGYWLLSELPPSRMRASN